MSGLILDSLLIRNFRGLEQLRIEKLGRVNLITGMNNTGKTSVLEALQLFAEPGSPDVVLGMWGRRSELDLETEGRKTILNSQRVPVETLFLGRNAVADQTAPIQIGPMNSPERTLELRLILLPPRKSQASESSVGFPSFEDQYAKGLPCLEYKLGSYLTYLPINNIGSLLNYRDTYYLRVIQGLKIIQDRWKATSMVGPCGLSPARIEALWDSITLTSHEDALLSAVNLIDPTIERLNLKRIDDLSNTRVAFARAKNQDTPVPLASFGEGANRLFGMALAIVSARDGVSLIDEIENGLHHSVQPEVWKLIFNVASKLNVQVFATTHSYECIAAFNEAAKESEEEGILISLARKKGRFFVGAYSEEELSIAVDGDIEVRG